MKSLRHSVEDFGFLILVFSQITLYANWAWFTGDQSMSAFIPPFVPGYNMGGQTHMGGEYFNIAQALADGRGYSDPFGDSTGPTGWSPPVLTFLMAGALNLVGGNRDYLTVVFLAMQVLVLAFTTTICVYVARQLKHTFLAIAAAAIVVIPNFKWMFQLTHDCVFQMFWVDLIFLGLWYWRKPPEQLRQKIGWGCLGGICALSSPIVGGTWAICTAILWGWRNWKSILVVAATSIVIVSPWIAYQSIRLGKFVPIKSNASFEQYQGHIVLPDGLVVQSSYPVHPYWKRSKEGDRYREIGETAYLAEKKQQVQQAIAGDPQEYWRKVFRRVLAGTVWFDTEVENKEEDFGFALLRLLALFPILGLVALALRRPENSTWILPVICCYTVYLIPYFLIAYYERYAVPITLPKMLLTLWLLICVKGCCFPKVDKETVSSLGTD